MAFRTRADLKNHAIGWLRKGYGSLGGGTVVRFPWFWMSSGECRFQIVMPPTVIPGLIDALKNQLVLYRKIASKNLLESKENDDAK